MESSLTAPNAETKCAVVGETLKTPYCKSEGSLEETNCERQVLYQIDSSVTATEFDQRNSEGLEPDQSRCTTMGTVSVKTTDTNQETSVTKSIWLDTLVEKMPLERSNFVDPGPVESIVTEAALEKLPCEQQNLEQTESGVLDTAPGKVTCTSSDFTQTKTASPHTGGVEKYSSEGLDFDQAAILEKMAYERQDLNQTDNAVVENSPVEMKTEQLDVNQSNCPASGSMPEKMECERADLCNVCNENSAKYRCPKCFIRTCSLPCVKAHKRSANCDGVRCKTEFVPMSAYNENHLLSDYRLLEEIARSCDNNDRDLKRTPFTTSKWTAIQRNEARRRNINLKLAPLVFTMHKENSTRYDIRSKSFQWHIEWHFLPLDIKVNANRVPDSKTVWEALVNSSANIVSGKPEIQSYLENANVAIFMRRMDYPSNITKYHRINAQLTIKEALDGKTVTEFPRFIVVLLSEAAEYLEKISDEVSPHVDATIFEEKKPQNRRNFHRKKFGRGSHNRKPYQKKFESQSRQSHQSHGCKEPPPLSFHNHTASDTFP